MRGDWGLFWASPSYPGSTRSFKTMPSMRLHLLGGVTWLLCPYLGALTSSWSHGVNTRCWLVEKNLAALWLVGTIMSLLHYYCRPIERPVLWQHATLRSELTATAYVFRWFHGSFYSFNVFLKKEMNIRMCHQRKNIRTCLTTLQFKFNFMVSVRR